MRRVLRAFQALPGRDHDRIKLDAEARPVATDSDGDQNSPSGGLGGSASAFIAAVTAALLSVALLVPILQLNEARLDVPFNSTGDAAHYIGMLKNIISQGWWAETPGLGAPVGQVLHDYPKSDDSLHWLVAKVIGWFTDDVAVVVNVLYLMSFPAAAVIALGVLRLLGVSWVTSIVMSVLFALLPYHFERGEGHLDFSLYYMVPLGVYFAMSTLSGRTYFGIGADLSANPSNRWRWITPVVGGVLIGASSVYYAAFAAILIAAAAVVGTIRQRRREILLSGAALIGVIIGTLAVLLAPTLIYRIQNGSNHELTRFFWESEHYGLKLVRLLLPIEDHRLGFLANLHARYYEAPVADWLAEQGNSLGAVGSLGLITLLVVGVLTIGGVRLQGPHATRLTRLSLLSVVAILVGISGGFAVLISLLIAPELRAWNRISIVIGFMALAASAVTIDAVRTRGVFRNRAVAYVGLAAILVIGALDQTSPAYIPPYAANAVQWDADRRFVTRIEDVLTTGAEVFEVPALDFPWYGGGNQQAIPEYDLIKPYLHSTDVRWSYGAVRGRAESEWQQAISSYPPRLLVPTLAVIGYEGVYIDRRGYIDPELEPVLTDTFATTSIHHEGGHATFHDLSGYQRRIPSIFTEDQLREMRNAALSAVPATWGEGFLGEEREGVRRFRWAAQSATVDLMNLGPDQSTMLVTFTLHAIPGATLLLTLPDGKTTRVDVVSEFTSVERTMAVPPEASQLRFVLSGPRLGPPTDPRDLSFRVIDALIIPEGLRPLASIAEPPPPQSSP